MLNQGRPTIEGRAKRCPNDKGSRLEMAHALEKVRGWDGWYMLSAFDRCGVSPGVGSFTPASERSEHRCALGGRRTGARLQFAGWGQGS